MNKDIGRETKIISSQKIKEKAYWLGQLSGSLEKIGFPYDQKKPGTGEYISGALTFSFSPEQAAALLKLCNNSDIRLFIILAAGLTLLLKKYTASSDIILVAPIYKQQIKGDYINTILLLKNSVVPRVTFKELLLQTARIVKEADENKNYPIEILMEHLNIPFYENECSLFDTALLLENIHDRQYLNSIKPGVIFSFNKEGTAIQGIITYNSRLYRQTTIERIAGHMKNLLQQILFYPDVMEKDIIILSEAEKKQLLFDFNDTAAQYPDKGISDLFAGQVEKTSHHTALICENASLTYRELDNRASRMAAYLKTKGVTADNLVALLLERSLEMITCILAVLKSGGAYMPIDPEYPQERIDYMLKDSGAKLLAIANDLEGEMVKRWEGEKVLLDSIFHPLNHLFYQHSAFDLPRAQHSNHLAYVIYTSGTTGKPKGSLITHKNVVRLLFNDRFQFDFNHRDIWTMFHSYCFDFSVWEMYGALLYGGKLVVVPRIVTKDPVQYLQLLKKKGVTILNQTPTAFYNLVEEELKHFDQALNLKYVIFGGEALQPLRLEKWHKKYPDLKLINMFGITETTVHVTYKEISEQEIRFNISNIGSPIPTLSTYIMDNYLSLIPIGVGGELCVAGEGVGRGYLNRPELNAEKFIENPYKPGERLYRSGDLARLLDTGEMEYMGRLDQQIKIRGFRVEIGEIQNQLLQHEKVKEAVVTAREGEGGEKSLYAYIVPQQPFEISELRTYLAKTLPNYMIPGYFILLERIPLTPNDKVDIKALPHSTVKGPVYLSPRNQVEETLAAIWAHELGLEQVGNDENYFNIGGDSIKAIRLLNAVNQSFKIDLKIVDIFTNETIEKLAQRIALEKPGRSIDHLRQEVSNEIEILKSRIMEKLPHSLAEDIEDIFPMSDIEKGMVYYTLKDPGDGAYHDQMVYQVLYRDFNPSIFTRALQLMAEKHAILRASFQIENYEEPVQFVHKSVRIDMAHQDISSMNPAQQEDFLKNFLIADRKKAFVVTEAPLWRIRTFQLNSEQIFIMLVTHHAILDGWSVATFSTELNNIYRHLKNNPHLSLDKLHSTYKDFIVEQMVEMRTNLAQNYWKNQLDGYRRMDFIKRKRGDTFTRTHMYTFEPEQGLLGKLENCARQYGSTVKHLCLSAYMYMLSMFSYDNDITAGIVTMCRPVSEDGDKILGCFLNTIPFRLKIPGHFTWANYIREVERKQTELANYSRISLFEISRIIGETSQDANPIFDTIYNFIDFHIYESAEYDEIPDDGADRALNRNRQRLSVSGYVKTNTLLDFHVDITLGRFVITINYTNSTFSGDQIKTLAYYFGQILKTIASRSVESMRKDEIISLGEKEKLLYTFNLTEADYPQTATLHGLFQEQVVRTPDRTALVGGESNIPGDQQITYNALNEISGRLAEILRNKGVKKDRVVGIMVERSIQFISSIFGILKAGGAYLPIDPAQPGERNRYMLQDSSADILLTTKKTAAKIIFNKEILYINDLNVTPGRFPFLTERLKPAETVAAETGIAYIIYTSGSTGKPKGVLIEHKAIINRLHWMQEQYPIQEGDTLLQKTPFIFDVSVWEIFWWSLEGGRLCVLAPGGEKDPGIIIETVQRNRVTVIHFVPSMLTVLLDSLSESGDDDGLACLKQVVTSGEALTPAHVSYFNAVLGQRYSIKLANLYGPTEAAVDVTFFNCPPGEALDVVPIGKPINNIRLYILDKHGQLQPPGAAGELCITGVGLARGYLNNPELTAEKFYRSYRPNKTYIIYRTGDLARWLPDGNIEFLGRIDRQIKIRGNRIELGEIENRLLEHPQIKEAAVEVKATDIISPYLCAYFVPQVGVDVSISQLKDYLQQHLPGYMLPSHYVRLGTMPLTASGKIDRKSLPVTEIMTDQSYIAPQDEIEKKLAGLWAEVLNITKPISSGANFFKSGGHSLNAVALISRIHKAFDVKITLESLFKNPTIQKIAAYLKAAKPDKFLVIPAVEKKEYYPLSSAQKRLYFLQQMIGAETVYNIPLIMLLHGSIDKVALKQTFDRLIRRHESFRTSFHMVGGEIVQQVHDNLEFEIEILADRGQQEEVNAFIRPFELSKAPLLRVGLIKKASDEYILALDMHHIIVDGVSFSILVRDFMQLYGEKELPRLRVQYKDFVQWMRMDLQEEALQRQETYWTKEFMGDVLVLSLPIDYSRPIVQSFEGSTVKLAIDAEITGILEKYAQEQETTVYSILLTLYYIFLAKLTNQEDIVIGIPVAGRNHADLENIIGMFVNTLALRNFPNGRKSVKRFLAEVKENLLAGLENQDYPIEDLIEKVYTGRDTSRNPLFSTVFVMQNVDMANMPKVENSGLRISPYNYENKTAKFDLTLRIVGTGKQIACEFEYCTRLFGRDTAERFAQYFINTATEIRQGIEMPITNLDILPEKEKQQLLYDFNDTAAEYPRDKTIQRLFEEQVEKSPDHIALVGAEGDDKKRRREEEKNSSVTYRQLNEQADRLAILLIKKGVLADNIVGIMLDRRLEMIIGILGILKSGGAYLPIDPNYPKERIDYMLKDSGAKLLAVADSLEDEKVRRWEGESLLLKEICKSPKSSSYSLSTLTSYFRTPANLAYIIYTSGTTGKSKGMMIEHRNIVRLLFNDKFQFQFNDKDVWTLFHSFCFDFSVWEMYGALLYGGRLVIIARNTAQDPGAFLQVLKEQGVTVLNQTPSAFYNLAEEELKCPNRQLQLKYVIFGGEALKPLKLKQWHEKYPGIKLINMFGITETTVHVTYKEIGKAEIDLNISNVGKPIPTLTAYVIDNYLKLLPLSAAGELLVGGDGVGRGYLNRPELTAEKFDQDLWNYKDGQYKKNKSFVGGQGAVFQKSPLVYRSGDLGRWLKNGDLEYLGRIDHQVKIRGYRIELGEIESRLLQHRQIKEAIVTAQEQSNGDRSLCAYITVDSKETSPTAGSPTASHLREYLSACLPDYMIPSYFITLEKMPLTANKKIDRGALPTPGAGLAQSVYAAPRNQLEAEIAAIWASVLNLEKVGITDHYFNIGGDSIKAIRLLNEMNSVLSTQLKIVDLFTHDTIEAMMEIITSKQNKDMADDLKIAFQKIEILKNRLITNLPGDTEDLYPMSAIEAGMAFYSLKNPEQAVYHDQFVYYLTYEAADLNLFKHALNLLVEKHSILRTGFLVSDFEEPIQIIKKEIAVDIPIYDISHLERREQETNIKQFMEKQRRTPFQLSTPPLWHMIFFKLGRRSIVALWEFHHAILDGWSNASFITELNNTYLQLKTTPHFKPQPLKSSYKDFIAEQITEKEKPSVRDFWLKELEDWKRFDFPVSRDSHPEEVKRDVGIYINKLDKELLEQLESVAAKYHFILRDIFLGAYIYMLYMLTCENDMLVGSITHNRPVCEDGDKILGCFLNTIPVRIKIPGHITWQEYFNLVDEKMRLLKRYERLPFLEIAGIIGESARDGNPLFDTIFNMIDFHIYNQVLADTKNVHAENHVRLSLQGYENTNTLFDFIVNTGFGRFALQVYYSPLILDADEVRVLCTYFEKILREFGRDPFGRMQKEKIIPAEERQKLLYIFNDTSADYPFNKTLHQLFEEQANKTPETTALIFENQCLTYRQLEERTNRLAHVLREKGVGRDCVVGIIMRRTPGMIFAIMGILKAGGAYLPLEPDYPEARKKFILEDSHTLLVINCKSSAANGGELFSQANRIEQFFLDEWDAALVTPSSPTNINTADDLAYIIYTSGSTGNPKGVMVEHRGVVNYIWWGIRQYVKNEKVEFPLYTSISFDLTVTSIFTPLLSGNAVLIYQETEGEVLLEKVLNENKAGVIKLTPSHLKLLRNNNALILSTLPIAAGKLRRLIFGGEELETSLAEYIYKAFGGTVEIINEYGPTETVVGCMISRFDPYRAYKRTQPIGGPADNVKIYLLDKNQDLLPIGVPGEICIGGDSIARGYLNNPELTAEKFDHRTLRENFHHSKLYRTGDLGKWLPNGTLEFLGRLDRQVKIKGYRIEIGEIESRLREIDGITDAMVTAPDNNYLCAYFTADKKIADPAIKSYLSTVLPAHMIPVYIKQLEQFPLTPNGKIDYKHLPSPGQDISDSVEFEAPRNSLEKKLLEIWKEVLGQSSISIYTDFFMAGGDSIKSIRIMAKLREAGYKVTMRDIFNNSTIARLALVAKQIGRSTDQSPVAGDVPLTPVQERFFVYHTCAPHHFNLSMMFYVKEEFDARAVETIFCKIQEHHDSLRMTYRVENGSVFQVNHSLDYPFSLQEYDLRQKGQTEATKSLELLANQIQASINLQEGPLMKLGLFHMDDGNRLLIAVHHLVIDGVSWRILLEDIERLYQQYQNGERLELPLKTDSFKLWAEKLKQYANSQQFLKEKVYWAALETQELSELKADLEVGENNTRDIGAQTFILAETDTALLLNKINNAFGTDINDILLTALGASIRETFGIQRVLVSLEGHGREEVLAEVDVSRTVGWFTSFYPILLDMSYENDLARQIIEVKEMLRRVPHKGIGYGILKYLTDPIHKQDITFRLNPQINFNYLGQFDADVKKSSLSVAAGPSGRTQSLNSPREFQLEFLGMIVNRRLNISVDFNKKQFPLETIQTLLSHFEKKLTAIIVFCANRETRELTPSDFGYKELSMEQLYSIFDE